jgi:hypothetical protein
MKFGILLIAFTALTNSPKTITPSNYIQTVKCFPDLKSDTLARQFSLNGLKEQIDEKYASFNEKLVTRDIYFTKGNSKRVIRLKPHDSTFEMVVEDINAKGELSPILLTEKQRRRATQSDINQQLLNADITSDEKTYDDTKLNNHKLSYKLVRKDVMELVFRRLGAKEKLYCHVKDDIGPVCICK